MQAANAHEFTDIALSYAAAGISNPGTRVISQGATLYRLASTYTKDFPVKGADQRPDPERYVSIEAYDEADRNWMGDNSSDEVWARLIKGNWWFTGIDLMRFKYASMEQGVPLSDCGRQALAIASFWNNAEFMVQATVRPAAGLKVFFGTGCKQTVEDPASGVFHKLISDPNVVQLFIPGMHVLDNARTWFKLEHRHRLRRDT